MVSNKKTILRLSREPAEFGETADVLEAEDFSSEVPLQHTHSDYEDDEIGLYVGLWDTEPMVEAGGPYACDEFMWLIEGECQIRNNRTGEVETVKAGTPFVIPRGYDCQWQQHGYLRKYYVISEHPEEEIPTEPVYEGILVPMADAVLVEAEEDSPFAITSGARPRQNIFYRDATGRFLTGAWACEAFESVQRPFAYHEFAYVQDGTITLTGDEGAEHVFNSGDAFFIPEGVPCSATVEDSVLLYFAIVKPG